MSKNDYPASVTYFGQLITKKISLKPEFKTERKAMRLLAVDAPEQLYLTAEQQAQCEALITDENFFTDINEEFLDGAYHFILTCEDQPRIICSPTLHHSYEANGKKVFASGSLVFENGVLIKITNNSGHYRPTDEEMLPVIKALYLASGKTLKVYESFCQSEPLSYPVSELIAVDDVSKVRPMKTNEIIDANTTTRTEISDYDVVETEKTGHRFGRQLASDLTIKYASILNSGAAFFPMVTTISTPQLSESLIYNS